MSSFEDKLSAYKQTSQRTKPIWYSLIAVFAIGVLVALYGHDAANTRRADGTVHSVSGRTVEYSYTVAGVPYSASETLALTYYLPKQGQTVTVYHSPYIHSWSTLAIPLRETSSMLSIAGVMICVISIVAGAWLAYDARRQQRRRQGQKN